MKVNIILLFISFNLYSCTSTVENTKSVKVITQNTSQDVINEYHEESLRDFITSDEFLSIYKKSTPIKNQLFISDEQGKSVPIKFFIEQNFGQRDTGINKCLLDLDNDNIPELLISYYTGGNHCCDGLWIGNKAKDSLYEEAFAIEGGWISMSQQKIFRYNQVERMGYFYECYSCDGDLKPPYDYDATDINFKYMNGKPIFISDSKNRAQLLKNLSILSVIPVPPLNKDRTESDCKAYRKNFAMNIVALYFNDNQDSSICKPIFYKYYNGTDRDTIWNEITEYFETPLTINYLKTYENYKKLNGEK